MAPLLALALIALAFALIALRRRAARAARSRARAAAAEELCRTGLSLEGDALGTFTLHGRAYGAGVTLENRGYLASPGAMRERTIETCVARVAVPLADQLVCKAAEIDEVMGPLPAATRVRTGHPRFDTFHAIFLATAGAGAGAVAFEGSYRAPVDASAIPWATAPILDALVDLGLLWLRVHDGRAELVFPPLDPDGVDRAVAAAAAVALACEGKPVDAALARRSLPA
jgi:hypothetical protein